MVHGKCRRVGPFDKRLVIRRCEQCRLSRTKCNGGRPCDACIARFTKCQGQIPKKAAQLDFIPQEMAIALVSPAESQLQPKIACLHHFHKFLAINPSPMTDLFSTDTFLWWVREDDDIRSTLVHIGNTYITNGQQVVQSRDGNMLMEMEQRKLYATIQTRLQKSESHLDHSLLLLVVLFCLLQLMSNQSSNICLRILDQATSHLAHPRGPYGFVTEFDKSTLLLFRILQGLGKLMRDQDTTFTDAKWCKTVDNIQATRFSTSREVDTLFFDCICTFIASLAKINVMSQEWLCQERMFSRLLEFCHTTMDCTCSICAKASTYAKHLATGQSIIQQASELLESIQRFEDAVRGTKSVYDTSYDMFFAHSLCLRIGTLRLFADSLWQNAPFSREALQESKVRAYACSALNHVENRLQNSGLEAVIYIEHLMLIGIEVRDLANRHRVISLLRKIRSRGFVIAEVYIEDLQLAWKAVPASGDGDS